MTVLHHLHGNPCVFRSSWFRPQIFKLKPIFSHIIEAPAHVLIGLLGLIKRCISENLKPSCSHVLPACRFSKPLFLFGLGNMWENTSAWWSWPHCVLLMVCFCSVIHHQCPVCLHFSNNKAWRPLFQRIKWCWVQEYERRVDTPPPTSLWSHRWISGVVVFIIIDATGCSWGFGNVRGDCGWSKRTGLLNLIDSDGGIRANLL